MGFFFAHSLSSERRWVAYILTPCVPFSPSADPLRVPRLLPCAHSLCTHCISALPCRANRISCPLCRDKFMYVPATDRKKNFALVDHLSSLANQHKGPHAPPKPAYWGCADGRCAECEEGQEQPATEYCVNCGFQFCAACSQRVHSPLAGRVMQTHKRVPLRCCRGPCQLFSLV